MLKDLTAGIESGVIVSTDFESSYNMVTGERDLRLKGVERMPDLTFDVDYDQLHEDVATIGREMRGRHAEDTVN